MSDSLEHSRQLLCQLGAAIRDAVRSAQMQANADLNSVAAETEADTIYQIDKVSETLVLDWLAQNWPATQPVRLVMEGIEDADYVSFPPDTPPEKITCSLIVDPIDGTRGIMYNKRSAWALIGLAPGVAPTLDAIEVAVMTELPPAKQFLSEQLSASRSPGNAARLLCTVKNLFDGSESQATHQSSRATDLNHGFASVAKFFPQAKTALAAFEEELYREITPPEEHAAALIFDDQYISTGGQLYELISGHDRLVIDIRPAAYAKCGYPSSLSCHPYDLCTALVAEAAGVIVRQLDRDSLDIPFDTTTPVSWVAYANAALADRIHPVVQRLAKKHFG